MGTKTKEPEEQNQQLHDKNHGQARQSFRFPAYDVVEIKPDIKPSYAMDRLWLRATAPDFNKTIDIKICVRSQSTKLRDLTGFNNTGNICVWPSEEVLGGLFRKFAFISRKKNFGTRRWNDRSC